MRQMVRSGEMAALVPERVWQELSRGLMEATPSRLLEVLAQCGALAPLLHPSGDATPWPPGHGAVLDRAAQCAAPLPVRYALLHLLLPSRGDATAAGLTRVPRDCRDVAALVQRDINAVQQSDPWSADAWMHWLMRCDAFRKPQRFLLAVSTCELWLQRRLPAAALLRAAQGAQANDACMAAMTGPDFGARLLQARVQAIARYLG